MKKSDNYLDNYRQVVPDKAPAKHQSLQQFITDPP
jgi:hypothetical protein